MISFRKLKGKYTKEMTIIIGVLTLIVGLIYYIYLPHRYFIYFPSIPIFFWIVGFMNINILIFLFKNNPKHFIGGFMLCKGVKFISSLFFILLYFVALGHEIVIFTLLFLMFYISTLIHETLFFLKTENLIKKR